MPSAPYRRSFDDPDTHEEVGGVVEDLVRLGDFLVGWVRHPSGWRWSEHMRPVVGGDWCQARHVGVVLEGSMRVWLDDGTVIDVGPREVYDVPPGHDTMTTSDEALIAIEWSGLEAWTGPGVATERVLAGLTMLDIVNSTTRAVDLGDAEWRRTLSSFHEAMRSLLNKYRGREIDTAGDGMFAVFDGVARAIAFANDAIGAAGRIGLEIRVGVHAGEVELGDRTARGIAVHEVARVMSAGGAGEIVVSAPAHLLAQGSGLRFTDRGMHTLKGFDEPRHLFTFDGSRH